jgi:hypothetical protein
LGNTICRIMQLLRIARIARRRVRLLSLIHSTLVTVSRFRVVILVDAVVWIMLGLRWRVVNVLILRVVLSVCGSLSMLLVCVLIVGSVLVLSILGLVIGTLLVCSVLLAVAVVQAAIGVSICGSEHSNVV